MFFQKSLNLRLFCRNSFLEFNLQQSHFLVSVAAKHFVRISSPSDSTLAVLFHRETTIRSAVFIFINSFPVSGFQKEVNMTQNERERLEKAHHSAQLLLSDVREIHAKTDSVAMEELIFLHIEPVANLSRLLGRLASQK